MVKGDILWVDFPEPTSHGHEQIGRRPAVIVNQEDAGHTMMPIVIPFTSNLDAAKYPHTRIISPSLDNNLPYTSVLLVFQLRVISLKRLGNWLGSLEEKHMQWLDEELRKIFGL